MEKWIRVDPAHCHGIVYLWSNDDIVPGAFHAEGQIYYILDPDTSKEVIIFDHLTIMQFFIVFVVAAFALVGE